MNLTNLPACTIIIFGATGDLAKRKLFPALQSLHEKKQLHPKTTIIAIGRRPTNIVKECKLGTLKERVTYLAIDFSSAKEYEKIIATLEKRERTSGVHDRLYYLATPPTLFETITVNLHRSRLASKDPKHCWHRILYEKPFGHSLISARQLNEHITRLYDERQLYRIDHYLAKDFVHELLVLRLSNLLFEQVWNKEHVDHVRIGVFETVGVESRGAYYDNAGALRDMMQNHLLQLLTLTAMDSPLSLDANDIRNEKVKVLRQIRRESSQELRSHVVLGQYAAGTIGRRAHRAYRDEEGVDRESTTETFASVRFFVDNYRWSGVPFHVRTGKALHSAYAEVAIVFKQTPCLLFCGEHESLAPNELVIRIQPRGGVKFRFNIADHTGESVVQQHTMSFNERAPLERNTPQAYVLLLSQAMMGDQTMFTRWDEVEESWSIIDRIRAAHIPIQPYAAGSWGPLSLAKQAQEIVLDDMKKRPKRPKKRNGVRKRVKKRVVYHSRSRR